MYRKLYSNIMSLTMIFCMIVTLFIPSCNVKAADIAMEYTSYEVLQWILMELGISASLAPEKQQAIVLPDGQEITKPNLGAELIREVNDSIELWWNANQMDDVVDGYDGGLEQFKSDFADMLEWGKDGVIEIADNAWSVLKKWGKSLSEYLAEVGESYFDRPYLDLSNGTVCFVGPSDNVVYSISDATAPVNVVEIHFTDMSYLMFYSNRDFCVRGNAYSYGDSFFYECFAWGYPMNFLNVPKINVAEPGWSEVKAAEVVSKVLNGDIPLYPQDVVWPKSDLKTDICGIPWELPDSIPYPHSGDATITIPQDLPIDDAITGVGTGELTWEDVIGKTFPIPIDKPIDKPAEGDTETDTEKDTEEETESEKEIEWDDTIFAPEGAIGGKLSELSKKFPFCIPFDVVALFKGFGKDVVETAPRWEVSIDMSFIDYTWIVVIDMKDYEKYVKIFRDGFYLLFLVGLFFTTRKLISWQID